MLGGKKEPTHRAKFHFIYLLIGIILGFIIAGMLGVMIGIVAALLLCTIDQLTSVIEKLSDIKRVLEKVKGS